MSHEPNSSISQGLPGVRGKVAVIGQGHIGLRVAVRAAEVGWSVAGYDIDETRVKELMSGLGARDGLETKRLVDVLDSGAYVPTSSQEDISGFDVAVIAVPTPVGVDGSPDLSHIADAVDLLGKHLKIGASVSIESSLYPGATEGVVASGLAYSSGKEPGVDFYLGYSPERVDTGNSVHLFENTPKIVSGINDASLDAIDDFYSTLVEKTVRVAGTPEAELAKLMENTFRQVNVALVNEIALAASSLGIDIGEALRAAGTKPFGYMGFHPGTGTGGHCLLSASSYLSWSARNGSGPPLRVVEAAMTVNSSMAGHIVQQIVNCITGNGGQVEDSNILILGLAYKPGVSETANSPAVDIANALASMGARVAAADPHVQECPTLADSISRVEATPQRCAEADVVALLVNHREFDIDQLAGTCRLLIDPLYVTGSRNALHAG